MEKAEAQKAFQYLNQFRQAPEEYGSKLKLNLKRVEIRPVLIWDTLLAKVAEDKAMDMARHDYFSHINRHGEGINILISRAGYTLPANATDNKKNNFYESIAWATGNPDHPVSATALIDDLIIDKGVSTLGHRKHLLGIDDDPKKPFRSTLKDIGIGYVVVNNKDNTTKAYMSVVIAAHN
ncbi:MAG TPA: CAP domain-containing protein [Bacteroidia bacterium]|nr:CAP domain-containing protein [Bacteroidia bacterium]